MTRAAKLALAAVVARLLLPSASFGREEPAPERARASGQRLAAAQAASALVRSLATRRWPELKERWPDSMLADVPAHARRRASEDLCRRLYRAQLQQALADELTRLHRSFHAGGGETWFSRSWLTTYVERHFAAEVKRQFAANEGHFFGEAFAAARARAVETQLTSLPALSRPSTEEIERLAAQGWPAAGITEVRRRLAGELQRAGVLLEEVRARLEEMAGRFVEEAHSQYQAQAAAVDGPVAAAARREEEIAAILLGHLEHARREWRARHPGAFLHPPFPSLRRRLAERAKALEVERFREHIATLRPPVSAAELRKAIEENPAAHRKKEESLALLRSARLPGFAALAVKTHARPLAGRPENAAFARRLTELAARDPTVAGALEARLDASLASALTSVRGRLAEEQLARWWPELAQRRWRVPERVLLERQQKGNSDPPAGYAESLALLGPSASGRVREEDVLEETAGRVWARTAELLEEGQKVWGEQFDVIDHVESLITPAFEAEGRDSRSKKQWEDHFVETAQTDWRLRVQAAAGLQPSGPAANYRDLFPHIEKLMRERVRRSWDTPSTPILASPEPSTEPPARPVPREAGDGWLAALLDWLRGLGGGGGDSQTDGSGGGKGGDRGKGRAGGAVDNGDASGCGSDPPVIHRCLPYWLLVLPLLAVVALSWRLWRMSKRR